MIDSEGSGRTNNEDETGKSGINESVPKGRIVLGRWRGRKEDNGRRSRPFIINGKILFRSKNSLLGCK